MIFKKAFSTSKYTVVYIFLKERMCLGKRM